MVAATSSTGLFDWLSLLKVFGISITFALVTVVFVSFTVRFRASASTAHGSKRVAFSIAALVFGLGVLTIVAFGIVVMMAKS